MANEITFSASLSVTRAGLTVSGSTSLNVTMAGTEFMANLQSIGTITEAIDLQDLATPGYFYFKNTDANNFVEIGTATPVSGANAFLKLLPGEASICMCRQTVIYAKADTGAVSLQIIAAEL